MVFIVTLIKLSESSIRSHFFSIQLNYIGVRIVVTEYAQRNCMQRKKKYQEKINPNFQHILTKYGFTK